MRLLESLGLWWHRLSTRRKMDRVFTRRADPFAYSSSPYERARLDAMEEALSGRRWERVLEIGCAEGDFTARLARLAGQVTALDISAVALARARDRLKDAANCELTETDVRQWAPSRGASYDLIVVADVLYYIDKPMVRKPFEEVFAKIHSWLAPGGRLLLAHAFAGPAERDHRAGFTRRFEALGLRRTSERVVEGGQAAVGVSCLVSVLEK